MEKVFCKACNSEFIDQTTEYICPNCGEEEEVYFIWSLINSHIDYCPNIKEDCVNHKFSLNNLSIKCIKCRKKIKI